MFKKMFLIFLPGARWDVLVGWETLTEIFDIHSYLLVKINYLTCFLHHVYLTCSFAGNTDYDYLYEIGEVSLYS